MYNVFLYTILETTDFAIKNFKYYSIIFRNLVI